MRGIQFKVDSSGKKRAVVIDLDTHGDIWEDFYDMILVEQRKNEPVESLEEVKARLVVRSIL